jgi:hypothetical protein
MDAAGNTGKAPGPELAAAPAAEGGTAPSASVSGHPLGPDAVAILATEHWSLIGHRSLLWNEAYSRTTIFLGALSAAIVALALVANASGFGPRTVTLALVLLPVVLFLGIATHIRVVEINQAEIELMLAMNRLRNAYLRIAPALEPYFSTSPHDDERGLTASYLSFQGRGLRPWGHFLSNTPTVIATVDAALAAAIAVLAVRKAGAATTLAVVVGAVAFLAVWTALFLLQRQSLSALRRSKPRFPTPPDESLSGPGRPYLRPAPGRGRQRRDRLHPASASWINMIEAQHADHARHPVVGGGHDDRNADDLISGRNAFGAAGRPSAAGVAPRPKAGMRVAGGWASQAG